MNKIAFVSTGARAPLARLLLTALCATMLGTALLLGVGCSDDKGSVSYPTSPEPQPQNWLFDVLGTAADNVYACGNKGAMFHFNGTAWSYVDMGTTRPITKLYQKDGVMYAVGHGGLIWRNTGAQWTAMTSGTSKDLYGIGSFDDEIYACGAEGTLRRLSGTAWSTTPTQIVTRDPVTGATTDTLARDRDLSSLLTVNHYFIGGAYKKPDYEGPEDGIKGTDGMVLATDPQFDWLLRPLRGDQLAVAEWVMCTTSNPLVLGQNFLGTSEGWLFQLGEDESGSLVWVKHYPSLTVDPAAGIRDMWLDDHSNLLLVTDDGQLVVQSLDYDFAEGTGFRKVLHNQVNPLVGIWGTGADSFYLAGWVDNTLYHAAVDYTVETDPTLVLFEEISLVFPAKGLGLDLITDEIGRPRF